MSGPKDSNWYIDEEEIRRREEERQRRLEEEMKEKLRSSIDLAKSNIDTMLNKQSIENETCFNKVEKFNPNLDLISEIKDTTLKLELHCKETTNRTCYDNINFMQEYVSELNTFINYVKQQCNKISDLNNVLLKETSESSSRKIIDEINKNNNNFSIKPILNETTNREKNLNKESLDNINKVLKEFKEVFYRYANSIYIINKTLLQNKKNEIDNLIEDENISIQYKLNQIKNYLKDIYDKEEEYINEEKENKKLIEEYAKQYTLYEVLCEKLGENLKFEKDTSIDKIEDKINNLNKEISKLRTTLQEKEDYDYIVDSINEVMEELGYDIISSEILNRVNRTVVDNIYAFDNNVLNVFTSDNGTIMFEVSGVSNEKKEVSSLEKLKIKESMDQFCGKYDEIKKRLATKGIFFSNENLKPADEKYARVRIISEEKYKVKGKKKQGINISNNKYFNS